MLAYLVAFIGTNVLVRPRRLSREDVFAALETMTSENLTINNNKNVRNRATSRTRRVPLAKPRETSTSQKLIAIRNDAEVGSGNH